MREECEGTVNAGLTLSLRDFDEDILALSTLHG